MKLNFLPQLQMTALVQACDVNASIKNTGLECNAAMGVTAMFLAAPLAHRFSLADIADIESAVADAIAADKGARLYPIFGNKAVIGGITNNNEADVTETLPNGQVIPIRPGYINRTFFTTQGGLCYASDLRSFLGSGYGVYEIDQNGQFLAKKYVSNAGVVSYGPLSATLTPLSPIFADYSQVYKNQFQVSYNPLEFLGSATILKGAINLLDYTGLLDVDVTNYGTPSTTVIKVKAITHCAGSNLYDTYSTELADVDAWVVTDKATGTPVVLTSVTVDATNKGWNLNGTFTTATDYLVDLATPANLRANVDIDGYESLTSITVSIP